MSTSKQSTEAERRSRLVLRLLAGEEPLPLAEESGVSVAQLFSWRRDFVAAGSARLAASAEAAPDLSFDVLLLGAPRVQRVTDGRREELQWGLHRALMVFAYLVLAPGFRVRKDELEGSLWPTASASEVRKNFHPTLSAVRRTLSGEPLAGGSPRLLTSHRGTYGLVTEVGWRLDTADFVRAVEAGAEMRQAGRLAAADERWQEAWRLYRGPLLAGEEAEWIVDRRATLHRTYLSLLTELGQLQRELGKVERAIDAYRALLLQEPFEEHAHLALMELYAGQGRRDLVRRQFVRLQELLAELNVEPMERTQQRFYELMR